MAEEAQASRPSDFDAMGQDKRRQVVGHSYGPSRRSQIAFLVAVAAVLVIAVGGYALSIALFDQPPDTNPDRAPWSRADAPRSSPSDPSDPCGEPGNPPPRADGPCAPAGVKAGAAR